ncbi:MAG: hypothetical protein KTR13_09545 [Saprospiraceae bacterium]|nr:hypothetical protein [Saprospiraceae bacterium]
MAIGFAIIFFLLLSIPVFFLDRKLGTKWNKTWYNLTHKDPFPGEFDRGFVAGRGIEARLGLAVFLGLLAFLFIFLTGIDRVFQALIYGILAIPALVVGFYICGFLFGGRKNKINQAMEYIDKVEKGEVDLKADALETAKKVGKEVKQTHDKVVQREQKAEQLDSSAPQPEPEPTPEPAPKPPEDKPKDWREGIDDFLKK